MSDRFKFRVWSKAADCYMENPSDVLPVITTDGDFAYKDRATKEFIYFDDEFAVIEQCTGLKDKNGKLIYEGDIIKKSYQKFIIKYDFDSFKAYDEEKRPISIYGLFTFKIRSGGFPEKETENTIEVIGNIHENPELLEKSDE